MPKYVYAFEEGGKEQKFLLGGKGANLAEMTKLGLPVPPGFTITHRGVQRLHGRRRHAPGRPDGRGRRRPRGARGRRWASSSATPPTRCSSRCGRVRRSRCRG